MMVICMFRNLICPPLRVSIRHQITVSARGMGKGRNHLPDRWTDYIPVGKRIPGTRFITFKVPLKKVYENKLAPHERFSPADLIQAIQSQNEELGLIVDLTCTTRYYWPKELPETLHYVKLFTAGQEIPNDEVIFQFKCIVKQFLRENSDNEKLIGVHCTHGLNRTGYLVCRYLIDVDDMLPSEAIEKFNRSRGHSIERKNYIDDLMYGVTRTNSGLDKPRLLPPLATHQPHIPNTMDDETHPCHPHPRQDHHQHHHHHPWPRSQPHANFGAASRLPPAYSYPPVPNVPGPTCGPPHMEGGPRMHHRGDSMRPDYHYKGDGNRHHYQRRRGYWNNNGKKHLTNVIPTQGPAADWSGQWHPYTRNPAPDN